MHQVGVSFDLLLHWTNVSKTLHFLSATTQHGHNKQALPWLMDLVGFRLLSTAVYAQRTPLLDPDQHPVYWGGESFNGGKAVKPPPETDVKNAWSGDSTVIYVIVWCLKQHTNNVTFIFTLISYHRMTRLSRTVIVFVFWRQGSCHVLSTYQ